MKCTVIERKDIPLGQREKGASKFNILISQVPEEDSLCLKVEFETIKEAQSCDQSISHMKRRYGDASRWKGIKFCARGMVVFLWREEVSADDY